MRSTHVLWYKEPAKVWTEALPQGNGRIGAMVFGGVKNERVALNEDSLWSGCPRKEEHEDGAEYVNEARRLLDAGDYDAAQKLIEQKLTGHYTEAYMPLGDILIERADDGYKDYRRELDMETGLHKYYYRVGTAENIVTSGLTFGETQGFFMEHACFNGVFDEKYTLDSKIRHTVSVVDGRILMETECPSHAIPSYVGDGDPLKYYDEPSRRGIRALTALTVETDGTVEYGDCYIKVTGATYSIIRLNVRTSYNGFDRQPFIDGRPYKEECLDETARLAKMSMAEMTLSSISMFNKYMDRVDLSISDGDNSIPTDERLEKFDTEKGDKLLTELLFNYGRYLTIAGSQPGTQAMNLQGIWNESPIPPWSSNYTININTEMNYYPSQVTDMSELSMPLFDLMDKIRATGRDTAKTFYSLPGSVAHHNTDLWGRSNPVGEQREGCAVWAFWPMGLNWLCNNLFEYYLFTLDDKFLKDRALPIMKDALTFLLAFLKENDEGKYRVYPATSPENTFIYKGIQRAVAKEATMSNAITRELINNYIKGCDILSIKDEIYEKAYALKDKISGYRIGSNGQILEWDSEYEEFEIHHRHTSHLYGLHPGHEITPESTKELAEAAKRTLEIRGDDGTGWSLGWKICFWARLNDGDHALRLLNNQLRLVRQNDTTYVMGGGTYPNMFDAHPPFQIDGNFGSCAGIAEMFIHSRPHEITLLPALPEKWQTGCVNGLKAMGNIKTDIEFEDGALKKAEIIINDQRALPVTVYCGKEKLLTIEQTGTYTIGR